MLSVCHITKPNVIGVNTLILAIIKICVAGAVTLLNVKCDNR